LTTALACSCQLPKAVRGYTDFKPVRGLFGGGAGGGAGGFTNTPEGKVITAAFIDSFNQMVRALRNYRAQTVEGGLAQAVHCQLTVRPNQ
jgi:hypothetical protein